MQQFINIIVSPLGQVHSEFLEDKEGANPYGSEKFRSRFSNLETNNSDTVDEKLPDGSFIHTKNTVSGTWILIHKIIK